MEVKFWVKNTEPDRDKKITYLLMDLIEYAIANGYFLLAEDALTAAYIVSEHAKAGILSSENMDGILKSVREEKYGSLRICKENDGKIRYKVHISKEFLNSKLFEQWIKDNCQGTGVESDWNDRGIYEDSLCSMILITDEKCLTVDRIREIKGKTYTEIHLDSVRVFQKMSSCGKYHEVSKEIEMRDIVDLIYANREVTGAKHCMGVCVLESIYQYYETWLQLFR